MIENRIYRLTVPAKPKPKQRARGTKAGHHFTPRETVIQENWVRLCCVQTIGTPLVPGPVGLRILLVMPIPASMPSREKADAMAGRKLHTTRPDMDNMLKIIDALNGIAWKDDANIAYFEALKGYGDAPRTEITWWQLTGDECRMKAAGFGLLPPMEAANTLM